MIHILTTKRKPKKFKGAKNRAMIVQYLAKRDGWVCHWCGRGISRKVHPDTDLFATLEHLTRLADGGTNDEANLALACRECNNTRHSANFHPVVATPLDEALLLAGELPPMSLVLHECES